MKSRELVAALVAVSAVACGSHDPPPTSTITSSEAADPPGTAAGEDSAAPTWEDPAEPAGVDSADTARADTAVDTAAQVRPPDILVIIADDFGLEHASLDPAAPCYEVGDPGDDPALPNLAALCARGVRFTNAWAHPYCSPTRASLLTGRQPFRTGLGWAVRAQEKDPGLPLNELTVPQALEAGGSGYSSALIGKWHLSLGDEDPNLLGWPHFAGFIKGTLPDYSEWDRVEDGAVAATRDYATSRSVDDAIAWLSERGDEPWLLWLAFNAPHDPFHRPPDALHSNHHLAEYSDEADALPWFSAMSEAMDTEYGRLVEWLEAQGRWENTVVIFLGDNGNHPLVTGNPYDEERAKGTLYQGGVAVPLVIAGPGIEGPRSSEALVAPEDLFATMLELAGVDVEAVVADQAPGTLLDSISLAPVLLDQAEEHPRAYTFSQLFLPGATAEEMDLAVRDQRYKLICTSEGIELYDLQLDPTELSNLVEGGAPLDGYEVAFEALRDALEAKLGATGLCKSGG